MLKRDYPLHPEIGLPIFDGGRPLLEYKPEYMKTPNAPSSQDTFLRHIGIGADGYEDLRKAIKIAEKEYSRLATSAGAVVVDHLFGLYPEPMSVHARPGLYVPAGFRVAAEVGIVDPIGKYMPSAEFEKLIFETYDGYIYDKNTDAVMRGTIRTRPENTDPTLWWVDIDLYLSDPQYVVPTLSSTLPVR